MRQIRKENERRRREKERTKRERKEAEVKKREIALEARRKRLEAQNALSKKKVMKRKQEVHARPTFAVVAPKKPPPSTAEGRKKETKQDKATSADEIPAPDRCQSPRHRGKRPLIRRRPMPEFRGSESLFDSLDLAAGQLAKTAKDFQMKGSRMAFPGDSIFKRPNNALGSNNSLLRPHSAGGRSVGSKGSSLFDSIDIRKSIQRFFNVHKVHNDEDEQDGDVVKSDELDSNAFANMTVDESRFFKEVMARAMRKGRRTTEEQKLQPANVQQQNHNHEVARHPLRNGEEERMHGARSMVRSPGNQGRRRSLEDTASSSSLQPKIIRVDDGSGVIVHTVGHQAHADNRIGAHDNVRGMSENGRLSRIDSDALDAQHPILASVSKSNTQDFQKTVVDTNDRDVDYAGDKHEDVVGVPEPKVVRVWCGGDPGTNVNQESGSSGGNKISQNRREAQPTAANDHVVKERGTGGSMLNSMEFTDYDADSFLSASQKALEQKSSTRQYRGSGGRASDRGDRVFSMVPRRNSKNITKALKRIYESNDIQGPNQEMNKGMQATKAAVVDSTHHHHHHDYHHSRGAGHSGNMPLLDSKDFVNASVEFSKAFDIPRNGRNHNPKMDGMEHGDGVEKEVEYNRHFHDHRHPQQQQQQQHGFQRDQQQPHPSSIQRPSISTFSSSHATNQQLKHHHSVPSYPQSAKPTVHDWGDGSLGDDGLGGGGGGGSGLGGSGEIEDVDDQSGHGSKLVAGSIVALPDMSRQAAAAAVSSPSSPPLAAGSILGASSGWNQRTNKAAKLSTGASGAAEVDAASRPSLPSPRRKCVVSTCNRPSCSNRGYCEVHHQVYCYSPTVKNTEKKYQNQDLNRGKSKKNERRVRFDFNDNDSDDEKIPALEQRKSSNHSRTAAFSCEPSANEDTSPRLSAGHGGHHGMSPNKILRPNRNTKNYNRDTEKKVRSQSRKDVFSKRGYHIPKKAATKKNRERENYAERLSNRGRVGFNAGIVDPKAKTRSPPKRLEVQRGRGGKTKTTNMTTRRKKEPLSRVPRRPMSYASLAREQGDLPGYGYGGARYPQANAASPTEDSQFRRSVDALDLSVETNRLQDSILRLEDRLMKIAMREQQRINMGRGKTVESGVQGEVVVANQHPKRGTSLRHKNKQRKTLKRRHLQKKTRTPVTTRASKPSSYGNQRGLRHPRLPHHDDAHQNAKDQSLVQHIPPSPPTSQHAASQRPPSPSAYQPTYLHNPHHQQYPYPPHPSSSSHRANSSSHHQQPHVVVYPPHPHPLPSHPSVANGVGSRGPIVYHPNPYHVPSQLQLPLPSHPYGIGYNYQATPQMAAQQQHHHQPVVSGYQHYVDSRHQSRIARPPAVGVYGSQQQQPPQARPMSRVARGEVAPTLGYRARDRASRLRRTRT